MTKKMDLGILNGKIEKNIEDFGKMENSMVKGNFLFRPIINGEKEFGKMGKE